MSQEPYLSPSEARRELGISTATYYRWLREGKLRGARVGRNRRFPRSEIDELLRTGGREFKETRHGLEAAIEIYRQMLKRKVVDMGATNEHKAGALAQMILEHAHQNDAGSVHIEPGKTDVTVRERIDGVLIPVKKVLPLGVAQELIRSFKESADLNVEQETRPANGRFFTDVGGVKLDVFVSTFPSALGESLTLRIQDPSRIIVDLEKLGLPTAISKEIRMLISRPRGVFIVNGPTGSGKSTTLYALLAHLRSSERKIMTAEDPVEFFIEGVQQADVGGEEGIGFLEAVRAMLRSDVDVAMISEVRDGETMQMLFAAAGTGHMVLTALHAPDALTAAARILEVGRVSPSLVAQNLLGILNQRLVRRSCPHCRTMKRIRPEDAARLGLRGDDAHCEVAHNARCDRCRKSGRLVVADLLVVTPELRVAIEAGAGVKRLRDALPAGHRPLREVLLELLFQGEVNPEEAARTLAGSQLDE
ncbi:MAG: ATPase, T2SS/T4P/T4SS family [Planctomycetota bacterium]|jgi:excisionase family DNA binding protein